MPDAPRRSTLPRGLGALSALAVAAIGFSSPASGVDPADPSAPAPGSVKLLPLSPIGMSRPTDGCTSAGCVELLRLIDSAKTSIDFAVYGLRGQPEILKAIIAAKQRGVAMRGIVDKDKDDKTYYADTDALMAAVGTVKTDHLYDRAHAADQEPYDPTNERCDRPPGFAGPLQCLGYDLGDSCLVAAHASIEELTYEGSIMHDKFFVIDKRYVWTGSANISDSDITGYSANIVVSIDSPEIAAQYTAEIDQMYDEGLFHKDKRNLPLQRVKVGDAWVTVWFPPENEPAKELKERLHYAKETIDVAIFYLTDKQIAGELIAAHRRGVKVRVIVDATSAVNGYTKHELLRAAGIPVKVENWGGKMHAKSVVIDGKVVFAGSMNWTSAGQRENDENLLEIESYAAARTYKEWYDKLWANIPDKWLQGRPDPEGPDSTTACTDGSDNDFDSKKDAGDPGCGPNPPPIAPLPPWQIVSKEDGHGLIKGDVGPDGKKTYHIASGALYSGTQIATEEGDRWFCSEDEARRSGFRMSSR